MTGLLNEYRTVHPTCQFHECVPGRCSRGPVEIDHLWNKGRGQRLDAEHWSNYISTCRAHHVWKHANSTVARIAATWLKREIALDTGDMRHFDLEALDKACGKGGGVLGWIESVDESRLPDWCRGLRCELLTK